MYGRVLEDKKNDILCIYLSLDGLECIEIGKKCKFNLDLPVSQIGLFLCATTEYKICTSSMTYYHHTKKRISNKMPTSTASWPSKAAKAEATALQPPLGTIHLLRNHV